MSYPGDDSDDTEYAGLGDMDVSAAGLNALSNTNEANRKARAKVREEKYYAPRRALYEKYGKDLEARRTGPSPAERFYEIGAALAQPKSSPGFAGTIANLAPVMAAQRKAMREAEAAKSAMLTKYQIDVGEQQGGQLEKEQETQALADKERLAVMLAMYKAQNQPRYVDGVGFVYPNSTAAAPSRPANVPANYIYGETVQNGRPVRGYASPDGKVFIPDVGAR
jgi:hypothetical protein